MDADAGGGDGGRGQAEQEVRRPRRLAPNAWSGAQRGRACRQEKKIKIKTIMQEKVGLEIWIVVVELRDLGLK